MADFMWDIGAGWVDCPDDIQPGAASKIQLRWPAAPDLDGRARPCGAVGGPDILITYERLSAAGLALWQARFASQYVLSATVKVQVLNDRAPGAATWTKWQGTLARPESDGPEGPAGLVKPAIYLNVRITIRNCQVTT